MSESLSLSEVDINNIYKNINLSEMNVTAKVSVKGDGNKVDVNAGTINNTTVNNITNNYIFYNSDLSNKDFGSNTLIKSLLNTFINDNKMSFELLDIISNLKECIHYNPNTKEYKLKLSNDQIVNVDQSAFEYLVKVKDVLAPNKMSESSLGKIITDHQCCFVLPENVPTSENDDYVSSIERTETLYKKKMNKVSILNNIMDKYHDDCAIHERKEKFNLKIFSEKISLEDRAVLALVFNRAIDDQTKLTGSMKKFLNANPGCLYEIRYKENGEVVAGSHNTPIAFRKNIEEANTEKGIKNNLIYKDKYGFININEDMGDTMREPIKEEVWKAWKINMCRCFCCNRKIDRDRSEVEFGHIIPVSKGGGYTTENIRLVCISCNRGVGGMHQDHMYKYMIINQMKGLKNLTEEEKQIDRYKDY